MNTKKAIIILTSTMLFLVAWSIPWRPSRAGAFLHGVAATVTATVFTPAQEPTLEPTPEPVPVEEPVPVPTPVDEPVAAPAPPPQPAPAPRAPEPLYLNPVTALGSQATVDQGVLVTWMTSPTCLLAGHDNMGWDWLDNVATNRVINVTSGPCAGNYIVVGHEWQPVKGGPVPSWMGDYALVLQTCTGSSGMGFSLAQRV